MRDDAYMCTWIKICVFVACTVIWSCLTALNVCIRSRIHVYCTRSGAPLSMIGSFTASDVCKRAHTDVYHTNTMLSYRYTYVAGTVPNSISLCCSCAANSMLHGGNAGQDEYLRSAMTASGHTIAALNSSPDYKHCDQSEQELRNQQRSAIKQQSAAVTDSQPKRGSQSGECYSESKQHRTDDSGGAKEERNGDSKADRPSRSLLGDLPSLNGKVNSA